LSIPYSGYKELFAWSNASQMGCRSTPGMEEVKTPCPEENPIKIEETVISKLSSVKIRFT